MNLQELQNRAIGKDWTRPIYFKSSNIYYPVLFLSEGTLGLGSNIQTKIILLSDVELITAVKALNPSLAD